MSEAPLVDSSPAVVPDVTPATDYAAPDGDAAAAEETDERKVVKQVEFYFSDSNLPYDKFMWTLHTKLGQDKWVPLATVASFKRMSEFKAKYSVAWIADVLRTHGSGLLEVDEKGEKVRRIEPVLPPGTKHLNNSVYAKGFPDERPGLQKEMEVFFEQYAPVASVRMRRTDKLQGTKFKNSVFCEYQTKDGAEKFLKAEPKPTFEGKELLIMSKEAYMEMKATEKGLPSYDKSSSNYALTRRGGFNAFKLMAQDEKKKGGVKTVRADDAEDEEQEKNPLTVLMEGKTYTLDDEGNPDESELEFPKDRVLKFTGAGNDTLDFKTIKASLAEHCKATFISKDFQGTDLTSGFAAFQVEMTDDKLAIVKEKVPKVGGKEVEWVRPSDDDERRFWSNRLKHFAKMKVEDAAKDNARTSDKRDGGKGGRGGRGGKRGGGRGGGRGGHGGGRGATGPRGEKRKRDDDAEENATPKGKVPTVATTAKKAKVGDS